MDLSDSLVSLLPMGIVMLISIVIVLHRKFEDRLYSHWRTVAGTVEYVRVGRATRRKQGYCAQIEYSYSVGGEYFSGSMDRNYYSQDSAERFAEMMNHQQIVLRVDPGYRQRTKVFESDQIGGWPK